MVLKGKKKGNSSFSRLKSSVKRVKKPKVRVSKSGVSDVIVLPKRLPVASRVVTVVYGMHVDPEIITRAAIEAYNKKRYTVHDVRLTDYIPDPKFRNLMVKIAVLDRIQEELLRIYPDAVVLRPNTITLMVR
jgi:hypothetical protein